MIQVIFSEPRTATWRSYLDAATKATAALVAQVAAGESARITDRLYKNYREAIFAGFHGKCAYCEAKFILDQTGDVNHFRPKAGVTDENDQPV